MLDKIRSDVRMMLSTLASLPFATRRAIVIVSLSLVVIGTFLFWPDVVATLGFSVTTILLTCALVTLTANDVEYAFGADDEFKDGELENDEPSEWL